MRRPCLAARVVLPFSARARTEHPAPAQRSDRASRASSRRPWSAGFRRHGAIRNDARSRNHPGDQLPDLHDVSLSVHVHRRSISPGSRRRSPPASCCGPSHPPHACCMSAPHRFEEVSRRGHRGTRPLTQALTRSTTTSSPAGDVRRGVCALMHPATCHGPERDRFPRQQSTPANGGQARGSRTSPAAVRIRLRAPLIH